MLRTMHPVLRYVVIATPACFLVFLLMSSFFTAWDGRAVSRRPTRSDDAAVTAVLILTDDGQASEFPWPPELATSLELPERNTAIPPLEIPEGSPRTTKSLFTLSFVVIGKDGVLITRPTTTPAALGLPLLLFVMTFFLYNITISGVPWSWEPRAPKEPEEGEAPAPAPLPEAGTNLAPQPTRRSSYGPPPSKRSRRR